MRKLFLPLILVIVLVAQNTFVLLFSGQLYGGELIIVPHFLFVTIMLVAIYVNDKYGLLYSFIFGIIYDVTYTEVLGIYLFLFPTITYLLAQLMKFLYRNIVISGLVTLIGVALLEIIVYEINYLIKFTNFSFAFYAENRLLPTIILNSIFLLVFAYPLKKQFEKFALQLENE